MDYLARLRDRRSLALRAELAHGWRNFETERYAAEVIQHLDPEGLYFPVSDREEAGGAAEAGRPGTRADRRPLHTGAAHGRAGAERLTHLWVAYDLGAGMSMGWLSGLPSLTTLRVNPRLRVTDVPEHIRIIAEGGAVGGRPHARTADMAPATA